MLNLNRGYDQRSLWSDGMIEQTNRLDISNLVDERDLTRYGDSIFSNAMHDAVDPDKRFGVGGKMYAQSKN